ncbi:MAG: cobalamin biosynthesis protein [Methylocystis sp.]
MARGEAVSARYAIGIGARAAVDARELAGLVREVAARYDVDLQSSTLVTLQARENEPGLHAAARLLDMSLVFLPLEILRARDADVWTRSARVEQMFGVGSVAEAAALAGAGAGSVLLAPRVATTRLTCAIARGREKVASP